MKKTLLATTVASLLTHASISVAQEAAETETLVVTANRFEQSTQSTTLPVVVVTKAEIEAIQANDIYEVLRRLPGIQVGSNGGYGQSQSLFVRGTNSDHVLVLIDGVRTSSATTGQANIAAIPLVGVQRVEFVRGTRAALYGSDAVGGVINIITDTSVSEAKANLGFASNNYQKASLAVSGEIGESTSGSFAAKFAETEGFSAQNSSGNEDADGHKVAEFAASLTHQLNNEISFKFNSTYSDGEVEYDPADSKKDQQLYSIVGSANYSGEKLSSKLAVSKAQDSSYYPSFNGTFQTDSQSVAFTNLYSVTSEISVGAGVDWYKDDISETSTKYDETSRTNKSAYVSGFFDNQTFQAELAVRGDDNQRYGKNSTWQVGLGYKVTDNHRVTANAGTAFKAPTFNDLYYPGSGNPDLKPEKSTNYELALEGRQSWIDWRVAAYQNKIKDMLIGWPAKNVGEAEIKGVELSGLFETGAFSHEVSLDFMDPKDKINDVQLSRRAKQSAKWNATYVADEWQADISYLYQGKRVDNDGKTELGAYSLVDVAASYFVTEQLTVRGRIANLFDQNYVLAKGYNTQERSYFVNLDYKF
ncbi:TonB-dependent receptor domain-containing protein [Vibrio nigripulchritudo]|uniref:TonB-dependent receptor domain-containing protein n=1 Tax=Vibrio nigripulchritudo TaxID=28173 RepID=UPI0005FA28D1|nr:TonB-dependent receptor [Vibrio nigripulchritudo]KJY67526.1 ligand-gated channel [Vibrio nigripulchritudo]